MSVRALITAIYCVIMTTGLPTPPAAPTGLSNGQITEGQLFPRLDLIIEGKSEVLVSEG